MTYNKEKWFKREQISLKIPCRVHPIERIRPILKQKGFIDSNVLSKLRSNIKVKIAGRVILVHTPPIRNGTRVMFVTLEDEKGLIDVVIIPEHQKECAGAVLNEDIVFLKGITRKTKSSLVKVMAEGVLDLFFSNL